MIKRPKPNWNGWIPWAKLHSPEIIVCCDCGLAHEFRFKNINGSLNWTCKRHKKETKEARRKMNKFILIER
mgnify:CR=1 FL=1